MQPMQSTLTPSMETQHSCWAMRYSVCTLTHFTLILHKRKLGPCSVALKRWPLSKTRLVIGCMQGTGLSQQQLKLCDSFVYIPQYGQGTASLNVTIAASIVLHQFAVWAGYPESSRHGAKYDVAPTPPRTAPRGMCKHAGTLSYQSLLHSISYGRAPVHQLCQTWQSHLLELVFVRNW